MGNAWADSQVGTGGSGLGLQIIECIIENYFSYFSNKTYVVGTQKNSLYGTQKNRLYETVLLSSPNTCLN